MQNRFFWRQNYQDRKAWKWLFSKTVRDLMDRRKGIASLVELRREDDTVDYGYLVVVRGDRGAKQDTPDLQLFVIRDAKNAIAKGKMPIGKDEFIKMAQAIAFSTKHRPIQWPKMSAQEHCRTALIRRLFACTCGVFAWSGCSAREATVPREWRTDCVGRMQLSLPGPVDVAANSFKMLAAEYKAGTQQPRFEFIDGQQAGYSSQYYMGRVFVSQPLRPPERQALLKAGNDELQRAEAYAAKKKTNEEGKPLVFERLDVSPNEGYADRVNGSMDITIALDRTVVRFVSNDRSGDLQKVREDFMLKSTGLALRPFGELPRVPGVCLPNVFIRDDDRQRLAIGSTYRLQDHPDVTIWLEDSSATAPFPEQDPSTFTARYRTNQFWAQREQDVTSYRSLWHGAMDVHIDGRMGLSSFVELTRENGTKDFGYLVVVRGDPDAIEDAPDLMLYVNRKAANAVAKGKRPIDKDEFLSMAQTIAASIKHRPVQ